MKLNANSIVRGFFMSLTFLALAGNESCPGADSDMDGYQDDGNGGTDCDDENASVYPGAVELCDGLDNDCDWQVDEGVELITLYPDADGDGFGDMYTTWTEEACAVLTGYVADHTDCDDADATSYPGAPELCDVLDNDCDGWTDEPSDNDGDGYTGSCSGSGEDCNDADAAVNPEAIETCNGVDDNCDGWVDYGVIGYMDADHDGYGDGDPIPSAVNCGKPFTGTGNFVFVAGDCDDEYPHSYPGAAEFADGKDNDCDGAVDEDMDVADNDNDGLSEAQGDCVDTNSAVNPDAQESCYTYLVDDDCDGRVDVVDVYEDFDSDRWGGRPRGSVECEYRYTVIYPLASGIPGGDCNDNNAAINPAATEVADGKDNDCDGLIDEE
jgi:hypothetical protein